MLNTHMNARITMVMDVAVMVVMLFFCVSSLSVVVAFRSIAVVVLLGVCAECPVDLFGRHATGLVEIPRTRPPHCQTHTRDCPGRLV